MSARGGRSGPRGDAASSSLSSNGMMSGRSAIVGSSSSSYSARSQAATSGTRLPSTRPTTTRPGTTRPTTMTNRPSTTRPSTGRVESLYVVALIEGRGINGRGDVGICAFDLRTSEGILSQFSDSQSYVKVLQLLNLYAPIEIIVSNTACMPQKTKLYRILEENLEEERLTPIARKYFNDTYGMNYIRQYGIEENRATLELLLVKKYYALASTSAVLKYIEHSHQMVFTNHTVRFKFKGLEGTMIIDLNTARNLELVVNMKEPRSDQTMFGILNSTQTAMGVRLLRANILQPLSDLETLKTRLDAVEEITQSEEMFFGLRAALKPFLDLDHLITQLVQVPRRQPLKAIEMYLTAIISLKQNLLLVPALAACLQPCQSMLLSTISTLTSNPKIGVLVDKIHSVINEEVTVQKNSLQMRNQRCYAVKSGVNSLLDVARRTYTESIDDVYQLVNQYSADYGLAISLKFSPSSGFYLGFPVPSSNEIPPVFVSVVKKKNRITCLTLELMKYNDRINESLSEVYILSNKVVEELVAEIRQHLGILYKVAEAIALLDLVVAFAHCSSSRDYSRPEFTQTLCIRQGRHPIQEVISSEKFVPNDTFCNLSSNFQVITGPNMSGKSTYLRQIALLTVMAHIGSFVPAKYASFRLTDNIFSRLSNDDSIETNSSTFLLEMKEMAFCLQNVTAASLVIVDELGRGTSTYDGVGITFAICEKLLKTKAFSFFTTHFRELDQLSVYPNVIHFHLGSGFGERDDPGEAPESERYKLQTGFVPEVSYGINLASVAGIPSSVLKEARAIRDKIKEAKASDVTEDRGEDPGASEEKGRLQIFARLVEASMSSNPTVLETYLQSLQGQLLANAER